MVFEGLILNNPKTVEKNNFNRSSNNKKVYIETYGCQMNLSDTEIVLSVLSDFGYNETSSVNDSDIIFLNTCSVRENAETKIFNRLKHLKGLKRKNPAKVIGILGCMAERLKKDLIEKEKIVDIIVGPDEYRKLPHLIENLFETGEKGIAVKLSKEETYDDITPVRKEGISAWISVMRGCDKFCTFCVVPFTRGRERSRKVSSIVSESKKLFDNGIKEITLLGQNVNSFNDDGQDFADLLKKVALAVPDMRIRYATSHPYDCSRKLLDTMAEYENICNYIHLPVQSGSERVLKLMNRLYSIEHYLEVLYYAKSIMPGVGLSTDIITGFPGETEDDHKMTLELMEKAEYDYAYTFAYSPRENTKSYKMIDDVPQDVKMRRLDEIIQLQRKLSLKMNKKLVGKTNEILIESLSKKSGDFFMGRTDCNKSVIVPRKKYMIGDKIKVKIIKSNSATLFAE
ncbi:MAG: tRNA (N6-isopentenyl adenosine(37)-C2)-methylthiotransferase MiaB [Ignavibacteria bacterium]|nr:tRNA (N6-isopentenyl adenosine(37)-C2)-methylthiotransferase MiaB [Ignavibacteria bacterium]